MAPPDIWQGLPEDGQTLAVLLATGRGLSQSGEFINKVSDDMGIDAGVGIEALANAGALEEVTLIQERRERLNKMEKPREIMLIPLMEVPQGRLQERLEPLTDSERAYLRLAHEIEEYERDRGRYPDRYKRWEEPRYRLSLEFQRFVERTILGRKEAPANKDRFYSLS